MVSLFYWDHFKLPLPNICQTEQARAYGLPRIHAMSDVTKRALWPSHALVGSYILYLDTRSNSKKQVLDVSESKPSTVVI